MSTLTIFAAFMRRDFRIATSYRAAFVLGFVSTIFGLALFYYLGHIVDPAELNSGQDLSGGYFGYAVVGLAVLEIVTVSLYSFSFKLRLEQTTGTFEALIATPTNPSVIILSSAIYELLRATLSALGLVAVAILVFGLEFDLGPGSLAVAAVALVGCLGLFTSLGVMVAAFTVVFMRATPLLGMVSTGLALLGGVYFPISLLPAPLETVAQALPFTWGLDVLRASLLGGSVDTAQLAGLFASAALLLPVSLLLFRAALQRARRAGTLAQY
jgi:ABC-type polysaccharide/polyol phosphate export permease